MYCQELVSQSTGQNFTSCITPRYFHVHKCPSMALLLSQFSPLQKPPWSAIIIGLSSTSRSSRWCAFSFASVLYVLYLYSSCLNHSTSQDEIVLLIMQFFILVFLLTHIPSTRFPNTLIPILQRTCFNMRHFIIFPTPCICVFRIQDKQRFYPQSIHRVLSV